MDDDDELVVIWDAMNLDAKGDEEIMEREIAFWKDTRNIHANAVNRMAESGEEGTTRIVGFLSFKRARQGRPKVINLLRKNERS